MKCRECGAEINDSAKFCEHCGAKVIDETSTNTSAKDKKNEEEFDIPVREIKEKKYNNVRPQNNENSDKSKNEEKKDKQKKSNTAVIVLLSILIGIAIFVAAAVAAYMFMDDQPSVLKESLEQHGSEPQITASPSPMPTAEPTSRPEITLNPTTTPTSKKSDENVHIAEPTYKVYSDSEMGFSCAYPTHFEKYSDGTSEGRYTLKNQDGSVTLRICAEDNDAGITLEQSLSMFKSKNNGDIEYTKVGNTYYAARINVSGICRYRYLVSKNNKFYWFDFSYPEEYRDIYENYIDHIYRSFTIR